jgi:hypothetical protein
MDGGHHDRVKRRGLAEATLVNLSISIERAVMKKLLETLLEIFNEAAIAAKEAPRMYFAPIRGAWAAVRDEVRR